MGFKALGLETCPAANAQEAREAVRRLTRQSEDYAIIYIEENLAVQLASEIWASRPCGPRWSGLSAPTFWAIEPGYSFNFTERKQLRI